VVGLLLVASTLAVSGGGILSSGGRLGAGAVASTSPQDDTSAGDAPTDAELVATRTDDGTDDGESTTEGVGTEFDYTCDDAAIEDLGRRRWNLAAFRAGSRPNGGYDQVSWQLTRVGKKRVKSGTTVRMEWMSPSEARQAYGAPGRVQGNRALVITFDGPVDISVNQALDSLLLEREDVDQIRNIQQFEGGDGKVHTVVGMRSDSCARLKAKGWAKKSKAKRANLFLQIERFDS